MIGNIREYQVLCDLGQGGMGEVYKARNLLVQEDLVAIKGIRQELSENVELRDRFLKEASVLLKLDHPNITKYRHIFEENGRPFLVMEYMDGASVRKKDINLNHVARIEFHCVEPLAKPPSGVFFRSDGG